MKINSLDAKNAASPTTERRAGAVGGEGKAGKAEPSAKVALSAAASQLAAQKDEGVFDAEKVQRISQAIRDGNFKVNPEAIADKLIANARELLGPTGHA